MANNVTETLIGALVLVAATGFIAYASQTTGIGGQGGETYSLKASFNSAEGLNLGTDVRMAGINIGSVSSMNLNLETYQAETVFTIREAVKIPDDSDVKVASEGLLGGVYVEIVPGGSDFMLASGDEILLTQSAISFLNLLMKFVADGSE